MKEGSPKFKFCIRQKEGQGPIKLCRRRRLFACIVNLARVFGTQGERTYASESITSYKRSINAVFGVIDLAGLLMASRLTGTRCPTSIAFPSVTARLSEILSPPADTFFSEGRATHSISSRANMGTSEAARDVGVHQVFVPGRVGVASVKV